MAFVAFFLATALDFWILDFAFALALAFVLANAFRGLAALALALANAFRGLAALALALALALAQVLRPPRPSHVFYVLRINREQHPVSM